MSLEFATLGAPPPLRIADTALFLDLDGTLAPLAPRPQDVAPDPRRTRLLRRLRMLLRGRLAIVTGRTLQEVDRILEGAAPAVAAIHGLVRRDGGRVMRTCPHPEIGRVERALRWFAARDPGLLVEVKDASVVLHYRLAPAWAQDARTLARRLAAQTGLVLLDGHMAVELRTPGPTKGDSVRAFMAGRPFAGATPVFIGDDATDEHGFEAARALGGFGVLVGHPRPSAARFGLRDTDAVLDWLETAR